VQTESALLNSKTVITSFFHTTEYLAQSLSYGLDNWGSIPGRDRCFSHLHLVQTGSGAHPGSYPMGTGGNSPRVKMLGREADHSPLSSAEFKNAWSCTSTPPYIFMAWYLFKHRDNFTFTFK
jgi:hypothetical protein